MVDDLIAFVTARLDEREHFAKVARLAQKHRDQMLREVGALRAIIAACAETLQGEESHDYLTEGGTGEEYDLARFTLRQLAAVWSDHPDCRPERGPVTATAS